MLATCNRCQKRKIKCDKLLPGCQSCVSVGLECTFYDHGSRANIPRSYVASLDERVRQLRNELSQLKSSLGQPSPDSSVKSLTRKLQGVGDSQLPHAYYDGSLDDPHQLSLILQSPKHGSSNMFFGPGTAAAMGAIVVKSAVDAGLEGVTQLFSTAKMNPLAPALAHTEATKLDRSVVTLSMVRELIDDYLVKIHPVYPVVDLNDLQLDTTRLSRLPTRRRFVVVMAAAISAAFLGRHHPSVYTNAIVLRHWADELAVTVLADLRAPRLQEILLLILYELVDPTRRLIWNLLGLACRMCIRLGWHRNAGLVEPGEGEESLAVVREQERRTILFIVLYEIERRVCHALGRPTILPDVSINLTLLPPLQELSNFQTLLTQSQLRERIFESSSTHCPFSADVVDIVRRQLDRSVQSNPAWLMLYSIFRHSCDSCTTTDRWEAEIERATISTIDHAFDMQRERRIVSIWLTTTEVFIAGAISIDIALKRRNLPKYMGHMVPLKTWTRCISLLSTFVEIWPAAQVYRDLFEKLLELFS